MPSVDEIVPANRRHLLDLAVYGHLGTVRPNDTVQVNPMWFEFDGEHIRFTHTNCELPPLARGFVPLACERSMRVLPPG